MKKVIMFSGIWCQPCQKTKPHFLALQENVSDVECQIVDVDDEAHLAEQFNIHSVPTFVLLKDNTEVARISGGTTVEKLKEFISQ
jgi:thioredoxin 1